MSNLRQMVDGIGSLELNVKTVPIENNFKLHQDVVVRRQSNRSGPRTSEVILGRILAFGEGTATVTVNKPTGTQRMTVSINDLSPATEMFKRNSIQRYAPGFRSA